MDPWAKLGRAVGCGCSDFPLGKRAIKKRRWLILARLNGSILRLVLAGRRRTRMNNAAIWDFGVRAGSQIGTSCHQPSRTGTGRYSVEQPHQSGIWSVGGGCHPCGEDRQPGIASGRFRARTSSRRAWVEVCLERRAEWVGSRVSLVDLIGDELALLHPIAEIQIGAHPSLHLWR